MIPGFVRGSIAPVFTAFREDGAIDEKGQRYLLDFLLQSGSISAYFVRSGMGQMYTYSHADVVEMIDIACEHVGGIAPVLIGANGIWDRDRANRPPDDQYVRQSVEFGLRARDAGASGVVYTIPENLIIGNEQSADHVTLSFFETVSQEVNLPVFVYQSPGTPRELHVTPASLAALAALPNVTGIKLSSADAGYLLDLATAIENHNFAIIAGDERAFLPAVIYGAKAVIGQGAAVNPAILNAVQIRYDSGDMAGAIEAQRSVNLLVRECPNAVAFLKRYTTEKGFPVPPHHRADKSEAYTAPPLTDAGYVNFKSLLETELNRFQ